MILYDTVLNSREYEGFEVLTVVIMKIIFLRNLTLCSLINDYQCFDRKL
jgi:hypothetical protein